MMRAVQAVVTRIAFFSLIGGRHQLMRRVAADSKSCDDVKQLFLR